MSQAATISDPDLQRVRDAYLDIWRNGPYSQLPWLAKILAGQRLGMAVIDNVVL